ncbi:hypothetical protein [Chryseobacterium sp.]|uniref:hypothetical protein n=1 Tax=Chryseobacterium sp. TaxID=1871047 RepID=UPI0011C716EF|nr:hypothetical protein [Chryseobacterium sp.]TXF79490.1 hypothetical protein FUA25_03660 [Chryseobacterium sp.]
MNLKEFSYDSIKFGIGFPFYGGYWANDLEKIIKSTIQPDKFERIDKSVTWNYSEIDFNIEKENIKFKLEINEYDDISLILLNEDIEESKQKLRDWATIIATEVEKLKK